MRWAEEMSADDVLWPLGHAGDGVDVEPGRVGCQDRSRLGDGVELAEDALLEAQVLEHRLDHEVRLSHVGDVHRAADRAEALVHGALREPAARDAARVIGSDAAEAPIERRGVGVDQGRRNANVGKRHRDAATHRAGANDRDAADRP